MADSKTLDMVFQKKSLAQLGSSEFREYDVYTSLALKRIQLDNGGTVCVPVSKIRYVDFPAIKPGERPRLELVTPLKYMLGMPPEGIDTLGNLVIFVNNVNNYIFHKMFAGIGIDYASTDPNGKEIYTFDYPLYAKLQITKRRDRSFHYPYTISCGEASSLVLLSTQAPLGSAGYDKQASAQLLRGTDNNREAEEANAWLRYEYF